MKVNIITAFYKGNQYIEQLVSVLRANQANLTDEDTLSMIIVNDSPEIEVELASDAKSIRIITQPKNLGIHAARVRGLAESDADYVLFLDQDDVLADDAIAKHLANVRKHQEQMQIVHQNVSDDLLQTDRFQIQNYPVSVSNAALEQKDREDLWYRTDYHKRQIGNYKTYLKIGIQIISPGQCLIPRMYIPKIWTEKLCTQNGADDYYLWLLLLSQRTPFVYIDEPLYIHKYTASNLSADQSKMDDSTYEFVNFLRGTDFVDNKDLDLLIRQVKYKDDFKNGGMGTKLISTVKNLDIFVANAIFKLRSKTHYGFYREG